jgi:hypothetical protein
MERSEQLEREVGVTGWIGEKRACGEIDETDIFQMTP